MCTHAPTTLAPALHLQYHATIWLESYWIHSWYFLADVCLLCILTLIKWWFWDTASDVKLSWYMCPGQQRLPAGIIISFWGKIENRACDDTTISLGLGFLHTKQKEWLFDVHGIWRETDGGRDRLHEDLRFGVGT